MARKAKKRLHQMPPLSFADKLIYWMICLILCVAYLLLIFGSFALRETIAFSDDAVIASSDNMSAFWLMVPWMTFFLMTFILWLLPYQNRRPIFGRKNFKYGPPAWPKVYPLFMKNKPYVWVSERKKREKKQIAIVLLIVLLVSFIPYPWSLYGRDCLRYDGSIVQYNMLNDQACEFAAGDISEIKIETFRYSTGKYSMTTYWGVKMVFKTDSGKKYSFDHRDFRDDVQTENLYWLEAMLNVKKYYDPAIISYDGEEKLSLLITDTDMNREETEMLYRLFGQ